MSKYTYFNSKESKPLLWGNGQHGTLQSYDYEEHEQYISVEKS